MNRVAVIGGGLMGAGIAQVFAAAGRATIVFEPNDEVRGSVVQRVADNLKSIGGDTSAAALITVTGDLAEAVGHAHFVTEAAPEKLELKRSILLTSSRTPRAIASWRATARLSLSRGYPKAWTPPNAWSARIGGIHPTWSLWSK